MNKVIEEVVNKTNLPNWWVEAIAIEYTECRDYATRDEIWTFNFDKLNGKDLMRAIESYNVVVCGTVYHNVLSDVFSHRLIERLTSESALSLVEDPYDLIAEGQASDYHVSFLPNRIETWDPKLSISSHFQVLDNGKIWQWQFAKFTSVEGRHYGKWISSEIDLEPLDKIQQELASLRNNIIKPGMKGHSDFKKKVKQFYGWIDEIRRPILSELKKLHEIRKSKYSLTKKTESSPPLISRFEKFTVRNNEIFTKFFAEPMFFRSFVYHADKAEKLTDETKNDRELIDRLDEIYQERAISIILATACLEAFLNGLGYDYFPKFWGKIEALSLETKWELYLKLKGKGDIFDTGKEPYQSLHKLVKYRNYLIHFKRQYKKIHIIKKGKSISDLEFNLPREFVNKLPSFIDKLIKELCSATKLSYPPWLKV